MWSKHDILVNNPKSNVLPYCVLIFYISACMVILIDFFLTKERLKVKAKTNIFNNYCLQYITYYTHPS